MSRDLKWSNPEVDSFSITAHTDVFYPLYTTEIFARVYKFSFINERRILLFNCFSNI